MKSTQRLVIFSAFLALVFADMDMADGEQAEFHPINATSKIFHWILTVAVLFMLPCISAVFAFAEKFHLASLLHIASLTYSIFESLFLDFPDNKDNHENRTSKGTGWFLTWALGATVFVGTIVNGTNIFMNRWKKSHDSENITPSHLISRLYKILSFLVTIIGWVRSCLAPVALLGFCYGESTGQCIAHGIMGSSFILYGFILAWVVLIPWIRNHRLMNGAEPRRSQEFWDSTIMCVWGIVNTFTEHRWGQSWSHGDYQHTSMGIIWWCGGLLGMWLSRKNGTRNVVPALLLIYTGYAMAEHSQHLAISTKIHAMFGVTLISGGMSRIIEICFLLKDKASSENGKLLAFQHLPPLCLVMSGIMFMSANEEQLELVHALGADHSSYILVVSSAGFLIYLWIVLMLSFYLHLVGYDEDGELKSSKGYANIGGIDEADFELEDLSEESDSPQRPFH